MKAITILVVQAILTAAIAQSVIQGQRDLAVTVYNNNLGVIKDTRTISFAGGVSELNFTDVASTILP